MVDASGEVDLGRLEGIVCGKVDGEEEDTTGIWRVALRKRRQSQFSNNCRMKARFTQPCLEGRAVCKYRLDVIVATKAGQVYITVRNRKKEASTYRTHDSRLPVKLRIQLSVTCSIVRVVQAAQGAAVAASRSADPDESRQGGADGDSGVKSTYQILADRTGRA